MKPRIGAWLAIWTGLWVTAAGCHVGAGGRSARSVPIAVAPDPGEPPVAVDQLATMGRRFVAGLCQLIAARERYCRGGRSRYCDRLAGEIARLEAIVSGALGAAGPPPGRWGAWSRPVGDQGEGRRVLVIVPVLE